MHDLDTKIRQAFPPLDDVDADEASWQRVHRSLGQPVLSVRSRRRPLRVALIAAAVCIVMAGAALAAEPELLTRLFPKGSGADRMEVMREPRPAGDGDLMLPPRAAEIMRGFAAGGPVNLDGVRILLDHTNGTVHTTLYAVPTESGEVCNFWVGTFGSGACGGDTFPSGSLISSSTGVFESADGWKTITVMQGLTTDEVRQVRVRLADGTTQDAIMGRNSFLWYPRPYDDLKRYVESRRPLDLPPPTRSEPVGLVLELVDGSTRDA
jgi:hypothetical protein